MMMGYAVTRFFKAALAFAVWVGDRGRLVGEHPMFSSIEENVRARDAGAEGADALERPNALRLMAGSVGALQEPRFLWLIVGR